MTPASGLVLWGNLGSPRPILCLVVIGLRGGLLKYWWHWHLRQGPNCDLDKGTYIIVNTFRIIKQMCLQKTLNVKFSKWRTIRASTTSNLHIQTISVGNSLCSHGNPTQLTNMLMNKTKEMASQFEWHSYCSSIWKYDNQCFWDALWLYYSTCVHNYGGTFARVTN